MRVLLFLLALLVTAPAAAAAELPSGIKGPDDRAEVDARGYPWSAIGRLKGPAGLVCTGTLVAPATVLTAAHCLWDAGRGDWTDAADLTFSVGYRAGWRLGTTPVTSYAVASGYRGDLAHDLRRGENDWALVHLAEPLGLRAGWLGLLPLAPETWPRLAERRPVVIAAGFSADRPLTLSAHIGCRLLGWAERGLIAHDCDATEGDSGAPLFAWVDGAFRILGLHVASVRRPSGMPFGGPAYADGFGAAVPAGAFAEPAAVAGATRLGDAAGAAPPTAELTIALRLLGFAPDDQGLVDALRAFERSRGLPETGQPSAARLGAALEALRRQENHLQSK